VFLFLDRNPEKLKQRQRALSQLIGQRLALQELHHEIADSVLRPYVIELANVGMTQRRNGSNFTVEALFRFGVAGQVAG
jgi:hypothetical protein